MTIVTFPDRLTDGSNFDRRSGLAPNLGLLATDERRTRVEEPHARVAHILEWTGVEVVEPGVGPQELDVDLIRATTILGSEMLPE